MRADVLARLVAPGPFPKRVTLLYRALPAAAASRVLQQEVNAAVFRSRFRRRTGRDEIARESCDSARARQAAAEEMELRRPWTPEQCGSTRMVPRRGACRAAQLTASVQIRLTCCVMAAVLDSSDIRRCRYAGFRQ